MLDFNQLAAMPHRWALNVGDLVTGAEGRVSCGWHGEIRAIETLPDGRLLYRVWWKERALSNESALARTPVLGMLREHIRKELRQ
jgi:hypothetical protein